MREICRTWSITDNGFHELITFLWKEEKYWLFSPKNQPPTPPELLTIFNLTPSEAIKAKMRYHNARKKHIEWKINDLEILELRIEGVLLPDMLRAGHTALNKVNTTLKYLRNQVKHLKETEYAVANDLPLPKEKYITYDIEYIRNNTPIELLLGTPVKTMAGGKKFYKCVFHNEKTPSFLWNDNEGEKYYCCFGCSAKGSIIDLYMHLNGCDFPTALKLLS